METVEIKLTQGKVALIDKKDYDKVSQHKWCAIKPDKNRSWYATSKIKGKNIRLSRFILDIYDKNLIVDHENANGLDNRRSNIRICNHMQNSRNKIKARISKSTSTYKGVVFASGKVTKPWRARITIEGKVMHIGYYSTEHEAAKAYDKFAKKHFKEFANLNFKHEK